MLDKEALKVVIRTTLDTLEDRLKTKPIIFAALNVIEFLLLDTPLFDLIFSKLVKQGIARKGE